jgi:hypothetical protein
MSAAAAAAGASRNPGGDCHALALPDAARPVGDLILAS